MTGPHDLDEDVLAREALAIHEAMIAWLRATRPAAPALAVVTACSYEIGRIMGQLTSDLSPADTDAMVADVAGTLRLHIEAYRRGHIQ